MASYLFPAKMKFNYGIHSKLMFAIILPLVIIYSSVIGWLTLTNRNFNLDDAVVIADSYASGYADKIKSDLDYEVGLIMGLRNSLDGFQQKPFNELEKDIDLMMKATLKNREEFLSSWLSLELSAISPGYKRDHGRVRYIFAKHPDHINREFDTLNLERDDTLGIYFKYKSKNKALIDNPYLFSYEGLGEYYVTSIGIPVPDSNGKFAGLVGVDLEIERFNRLIDTIKPFGGYAFLLTNDGTIIAHPDRNNAGKSFIELNKEEEEKQGISSKIASGQTFSFFTKVTWDGKKRFVTFAPVNIKGIEGPWSLGVVVPLPNIMERSDRNTIISIVIWLISLLVMSAIAWFISRNITHPLRHTTKVLGKLSRGELFDIEPIRVGTRDELGQMSRELNTLTRNLKKIADFAVDIGEGKFETVYNPLGDNDVLGKALLKMQKDLIETNKKLEKSISMAVAATNAKSLFLANMSHEIRTPLNGIIGMTDILKTGKLTAVQKEYLDIIDVSGNNLLTIINDILDFSKIESGQIELEQIPLNIRHEINQVIRLLSVKANLKNIFLKTEIAKDVPETLLGDPVRLRQILVNLINNAIKFTEKGGITITVEVEKRRKKSISLIIRVTDTGIGISPEGIKRLFKSFSQTDISTTRKYGGTGLGLAISKKLVTIMRGEIGVESEVDKGSTFWFTCRLKLTDSQDIITKSADKGENTETRKLNILLAEDNKINQKVVSLILSRMGHKSDIADNGKMVLEMVENKRYDLILMDVQMPEMDGIEATMEIRKSEIIQGGKRRIPIIAMTANALRGDRERFLEAGMDSYLSKPFKPDELEEILRNINL